MSAEVEQLEAGIAALEAQRALLGDLVVDAMLAPARARVAALKAAVIQSPPEPTQALKQVSILFLDVVGSTTLAQRLDPEAVSAAMDDALQRGTTVVLAHHGKVLQYAGDNILAAFGADEVKEDDPERAVRCGLALLALGKTLSAEVRTAHGYSGFDVRMGIHTGGVLLGGGVDADGTIRGQAVNIAARMEQTAPAGCLRISHDTYNQVRGMFEVQVQEPLAVKGLEALVQSYLVIRAKPRNFRNGTRGIEGVATRMIARDAELEALQQAFKRLFIERRLAIATVVAEAGIGKSRLLNEFCAWSEAQPESYSIFRGRANPLTPGQPFGLLRDILTWRLQIADDDTIDAARAKVEQGIVPLFVENDGHDFAQGQAHLLGHLIGIEWRESRHIRGILDDPKQIRERALHAAAEMFCRVVADSDSPVILQLEDLHWADNDSLDFLVHFVEVNSDLPMLVLAFSRPTLFERRDDWPESGLNHLRIDLAPLDKTASGLLADELLQKLPEIPASLRELVIDGSEGNPFYMEELVRMLIDQGVIGMEYAEQGHWTLNDKQLVAMKVPATLTGVLQARLDALPAAERLTLQAASVIGPVFWDRALLTLDSQAATVLPHLVSRGLTLPRADAAIDSLREYAFRHQILHQVTYGTVLKRSKRAWHAKVAEFLANLVGLRASDFLAAVAEHYERAGDTANAAEFHARAAEHAQQRFGHEAVLYHVGRALELLGFSEHLGEADEVGTSPQTSLVRAMLHWRLLQVREQSLDLQGRRDEQRNDIEAMFRLAENLNDDRQRAYVAWRQCSRAMRTADWQAGEQAARRAQALAARVGDHPLRLNALRLLALAQAMQGDLDGGEALACQGLEEAKRFSLLANQGTLLSALALIANLRGSVMDSLGLGRQVLEIERQTGNRRNEAIALSNLGIAWRNLGDLGAAQRDLESALSMLRANGDRVLEGNTLAALSTVAHWQGDDTRALALARSALGIAVAARARDKEVEALICLGEAELSLERHAAAGDAFDRARELARELADPMESDACAGLARVALAQGDAFAAMNALRAAMRPASDALLDPRSLVEIGLVCHQAMTRVGDPRADEWLQRAHSALVRQAAYIPEGELRQGFMCNLPSNREITALWAARVSKSKADDA